jgi:hypothetical protein
MFLAPSQVNKLNLLGFSSDSVAFFGSKPGDWKVDPVVDRVLKKMAAYDQFDHTAYGRIRETHISALNGILKYDGDNSDPRLPPDILQETKEFLFKKFAPFFDTCSITADDDVEMPLDTHPGVHYRGLGYKSKGSVFRDPKGMASVMKFWENPQFPTVWKEAVKGGELLKKSKIDKGDSRVFLIPGLDFHWLCVKLLQTQHSLFLELAQNLSWPIKIGFSLHSGGFVSLMKSLSIFKYIVEGDCTKWDSSLLPWIWFNFILPLRIKLFKPSVEISREEFARRLLSVYKDVCYTIVVLPNGQVIVKLRGMPSGFFLTGDDNSLAHEFIRTSFYILKKKYSALREDRWFLAADDHLFGTNDPEIANFEARREHYAKFGVTLTQEKDLVTESVEGHTFLGFTAHKNPQTESYVPVFNFDKAMCSALRPGGSVSEGLRYVRLCALRILCYFHPKYELIKEVARQIYLSPHKLTQEDVLGLPEEQVSLLDSWPTDRAIENLWLGNERVGLGGTKIDPGFISWALSA